MAQAAKIQVPVPEVSPAIVSATTTFTKEKRKVESETKVGSSEPSSARKSEKKKKRDPSTESEEEEESTAAIRSSEGDDEKEPSTSPSDKACKMDTRSMGKKKPPPTYKSSVAPKRSSRTPAKGGSFQKKPRRK